MELKIDLLSKKTRAQLEAKETLICPVCGGERPYKTKNENGVTGWNRCQLHVAAKEMFEALKRISDYEANDYGIQIGDMKKIARAAIKKAA